MNAVGVELATQGVVDDLRGFEGDKKRAQQSCAPGRCTDGIGARRFRGVTG